MNDYDSEVAELLEDIDESDDTESDEERSTFRRFRPKVASGNNLFKGRPQGNYVTQVQLQSALTRVGSQIKVESDAIKGLSTRVNSIGSDIVKTRRTVGAVKKEVSNDRMMSILPLLLTKPPVLKSFTATTGTGATEKTEDVTVTDSVFEKQDNMLPLLLLMGMGGMGGGDGKGDDNSMMLMALVLLNK
jgi:hypothetical protein